MSIKIATWNLDRPNDSSLKQKERNKTILGLLEDLNADLLILTETNVMIDPGKEYTPLSSYPLPVPGQPDYNYKYGENLTTIWSKYPLRRVKTRNPTTSVCASVHTPMEI